MNIILCNLKTTGRPNGSSLSAGSGFLRRMLPTILVLVVLLFMATGWGIGLDKVYAETLIWEGRVSGSNDDAEESKSGTLDIGSSDLELTEEHPPDDEQVVGMRFQGVNIAQGALISKAYIEFATDETHPTETTYLVFRGQYSNDADPFDGSKKYDISYRPTTSEASAVSWTIEDPWPNEHELHQSPDLSKIIQEIVDQSGWMSGNAIVIIVTGSGQRYAESYDGSHSLAPMLHIEYEGGSDKIETCRIYFRNALQAEAAGTNSVSVPSPPDGTEKGDLMIATVAASNGGATLSAPSGWEQIPQSPPAGEAIRTRAWYKMAGSSESGPYVFSADVSGDEMLVQIASFYSSAHDLVKGWHLVDSSYQSQDLLSTITSGKVRTVDNSLLYLAGSYGGAGDILTEPISMTFLSEKMTASVSLETYFEMRDAGSNIAKDIEWNASPAFLAAVAAVFRCQSTEEHTVTASAVGKGTITPSGENRVPDGGSITFFIVPDSGYQIYDIVDNTKSKGALSQYTIDPVKENHTIEVSFTASTSYTILASVGSNGSIDPSGSVLVAPGANQLFEIQPNLGYVVDQVWIDGKKQKAMMSYTFEDVNENGHTISATFIVDEAAPPDDSCTEISDIPLDARFQSAPPNILIALDDSGSMSYEILVPGAKDGRYEDQYDYVFDNPCGDDFATQPGCHEYWRYNILERGEGGYRRRWVTQWAGYNKMYYDPAMDYKPWPKTEGVGRMDNADVLNPRAHPMYDTPTFDFESSYDTVEAGSFILIADDQDTDIFTKTGNWLEVQGSGGQSNHYWAARDANPEPYTATWTPYMPNGTYKVIALYTNPLNDRSNNVQYTIKHAGGTSTVYKSQASGSEVELGVYTFDSGIAEVSVSATIAVNNKDTVCADAIKFVPEGTFTIDIPRPHYYVKSAIDGKPYLVALWNGLIDYYEFNDDGDNEIQAGELLPAVSPPADVKSKRSYVQELQNFANWFTYYRRRGYTATFATAELITSMQAVRIGLFGINIGQDWNIIQPVVNVKNDGEDKTPYLLGLLYDFKWKGGTPLRRALEAAGRYFDQTDGKYLDGTSDSGNATAPWDSADHGGECQQAFTILITDGYYNGSNPKNGAIGNVDENMGVPYEDDYSKTLADVAMFYYDRDLSTILNNNVPVNPYDDNKRQHMVTYSVGFGVQGKLNPDDYDADLKVPATIKEKATGLDIEWTDPGKSGQVPEKIDDLWHAAVNGRGEFLNSGNPKDLVEALQAVMKNIQRRVFSASGVAINGDQLYQKLEPDLLMFQASYSSEGWTGDVKAFEVNAITGEVETLKKWSAAEMLDSKPWNNRVIVSHNGANGIPFQFEKLSPAQRSLLPADDSNAQNIMDYLHGDTSKEEVRYVDGTLRYRYTVLGDIVHSTPAFKNDILYAGANDGMLHAFDVITGEELFAYVPNLVFANLSALADPNYEHRYYVDLTPTIRDVTLSGVSTMLVGGLGKGGLGYFALNISGFTPTTVPGAEIALADQVMWEYPIMGATPSTEVEDLGYSFSRVSLVKSNDTTNAPWVVIFGNGYNSANGHAVLFILDAETGTVLRRIDTGVGDCNGLSTPVAVDVDDNGTVDYVYAGDLKGNLWKFDLSANNNTQWNVAYNDSGTPKPLFQASGQPITTKPSVMYHCEKDGYMVIFGTGRYLGMEDIADTTSKHAIYGIWDYGDDGEGFIDIPENKDPTEYIGAFDGSHITDTYLPDTVSLLQQTDVDDGIAAIRTLSKNAPNWKATTDDSGDCGDNTGTEDCDPNLVGIQPDPVKNVGWYFELPEPGERVISDVQIRAGRLTVISYVNEGSTCGLAGHSWVMVMDPCTGGRLQDPYFDLNNDGIIDYQDLIDIDGVKTVPTGIRIEGKVQMPSYLIDGRVEKGYYGKGGTGWEEILGAAARQGMTYWRVLRK